MRYFEVKGILGSRHFTAPFDMYDALVETKADMREARERNVFFIWKNGRIQCAEIRDPMFIERVADSSGNESGNAEFAH